MRVSVPRGGWALCLLRSAFVSANLNSHQFSHRVPALTLSLPSHFPSRLCLRARPLDLCLLPDPAHPGKVPSPDGPSPVLPKLPPAWAPRSTQPGPRGRAGLQEVTGPSPRMRHTRTRGGSRSSAAEEGAGSRPGLAAQPCLTAAPDGAACCSFNTQGRLRLLYLCYTIMVLKPSV